mmetsp:Transcript_43672/g.103070  ORF Transcript_43672/g.103070 Transcript_43672/m.103070 type:complete len:220 (+) Transcript_43672:1172-1831(+)
MVPQAGQGICSLSKSAPFLVAKSAHCRLKNPSKHWGQKWCMHESVSMASPGPVGRPQSAHSNEGGPTSLDRTSLLTSNRVKSKTSNDSQRGRTIAVKLVRIGPICACSGSFRINGPVPPSCALSSGLGALRGASKASAGTPGKDLLCFCSCTAAATLRQAATSSSRACAKRIFSSKGTSSSLAKVLLLSLRLKRQHIPDQHPPRRLSIELKRLYCQEPP